MNSTEIASDFKFGEPGEESVLVSALLAAINKHCGNMAEESDFSISPNLLQRSRDANSVALQLSHRICRRGRL
jgi:hypothetical protein